MIRPLLLWLLFLSGCFHPGSLDSFATTTRDGRVAFVSDLAEKARAIAVAFDAWEACALASGVEAALQPVTPSGSLLSALDELSVDLRSCGPVPKYKRPKATRAVRRMVDLLIGPEAPACPDSIGPIPCELRARLFDLVGKVGREVEVELRDPDGRLTISVSSVPFPVLDSVPNLPESDDVELTAL